MIGKNYLLKGIATVSSILLLVFVYQCKYAKTPSEYLNPTVLATHFNGEEFVGSASCMECHADIYATHLKTAHYNTSSVATPTSVKASFEQGSNVLDLKDVAFKMKQIGDTLYQHTNIKNRNVEIPPTKFDIVIGSGVKGQSYLTWDNEELFQLQPSFYTPLNDWVNSPSFPTFSYTRAIGDACLKCHLTFATNRNPSTFGNQYNKEQMVYGVDCERCHRPSAKHVAYHRANPEAKLPKFAMDWKGLPRQQRLDACAQCHSGLRQQSLKGTPFSFVVGENLKDYSQNYPNVTADSIKLDVHGNQYGLLTGSPCFKQTESMDCTTCHDPHKNQRGNTGYFNQKCMQCHTSDAVVCKADAALSNKLATNCIACHMPTMPSQSMTVALDEESPETPFYVRTHAIAIYPEELWNDQ